MNGRIPALTARYIDSIRGDGDPTHRALAMLRAVQQHVIDLHADDPGDNDRTVVAALERLTANLAMVETDLFDLVKGA